MKRILLSIGLAVGCASPQEPAPSFHHRYEGWGIRDSEIRTYFFDFAARFGSPDEVAIVLGRLDDGYYGIARKDLSQSYCEVVINEYRWKRLAQIRRAALIWHEAAHCNGIGHSDDAGSLMFPQLLSRAQLLVRHATDDQLTTTFKSVYVP